jgi:hypothetical protein
MKKFLFSLAFLFATTALAVDVKISQLPLGSASTTGASDSFPYVAATTNVTKRLTLWDLINLPPIVSTYAPLASPTFTGTVTAPTFVGAFSGTVTNATHAATVSTTTNASYFPLFVSSSSNSNQVFNLGTGLTFNPSTNVLSTTTFSGAFSGTATNATNGATVSTSSNASFFPLFAASSSNGNQPFNLGTGLSFNPSTNNLSTTTFTGALVGNASTATALTSTLGVTAGGTGLTSGTSGGILRFSGTTTLASTTATYPATTTANQLLYSSATNTIGGLASANTGVVVTNSSGVPSVQACTTANRVLRTDGSALTCAQVAAATDVSGILPIANGGVGVSLAATGGTSQVLKQVSTGATITVAQLNFTDLAGTASAAQIPSSIYTAPTVQKFLATPTQTGWLFTISTSSTVAVGDTYTNNSNTYTVQGALTAQSGQVLFMSGTGATSGGTLTRATGSGTSSITFTTKVASGLYTTPTSPRTPLALLVECMGAGGGGGPGRSVSVGATDGLATFFGANVIKNGPGVAGGQGDGGAGGAITAPSGTGIASLIATAGGQGNGNFNEGSTVTAASPNMAGGAGAAGAIGGAGAAGSSGGSCLGSVGVANTGSGGGGGCTSSANGAVSGSGGGAGAYSKTLITGAAIAATFPVVIGTGGTGATSGSGAQFAGGNGADGFCTVTESYQ